MYLRGCLPPARDQGVRADEKATGISGFQASMLMFDPQKHEREVDAFFPREVVDAGKMLAVASACIRPVWVTAGDASETLDSPLTSGLRANVDRTEEDRS